MDGSSQPNEFEAIILKRASDGSLVQLRDVGRAELGAEDYSSNLDFNGHEVIGVGILQLPNANALDVDAGIRRELERLSHTFPPGLKYVIAFDTTTAVGESIQEVLKTLVEAIGIVVIVIFLFLQSWRSTLIPAITIPVSLIGTFGFIKLFGFSINTLTLFGITLATGLVVDDAIVVIENVERHMEEGITRRAAGLGSGDERSYERGDSNFSGADCRIRARVVVPGNDGSTLSAVRVDDCVLDRTVGIQRVDFDARSLCPPAEAATWHAKPAVCGYQSTDRKWNEGLYTGAPQHGALAVRSRCRVPFRTYVNIFCLSRRAHQFRSR